MPGGIFDNDFLFGRATSALGPPARNPAVQGVMDQFGISESEAQTILRAQAGLIPFPADVSSGGGGGGGGGGYVDHFFDVNPLDQAQFDHQVGMDSAYLDLARNEDARAGAMFEHQQAMDDRDFALAMGDFQLAQRRQDDANYWEGISAGLEQQRINLMNQGQQLDFTARMEGIAAQREASNQRYQADMANATNDRDRIRAENVWRQEQAQIARMEDETRRILGGQQNQTAQFGAETQRAAALGQLALDTNRFIMESATNPRNLPALFMMQRGVAPDWDTLAAGGTPATGQALRPYDPMRAYIPTTAAPTFNGTPQNSQAAAVGSYLSNFQLGDNPFINLSQLSSGTSSAAAGGVGFIPFADTTPSFAPPSSTAPPISIDYDINPGGRQGGVPLAALRPGMNLSTVGGGDRLGSAFTMPAYYDKAKTRPIGPNDVVAGGSQVWIDYTPEPARYALGSKGKGRGGFITDKLFMAGDAPSEDPSAGGARPEVIENPTGAPLRINSNQRTQDEMRRRLTPAVRRAERSPFGRSLADMRGTLAERVAAISARNQARGLNPVYDPIDPLAGLSSAPTTREPNSLIGAPPTGGLAARMRSTMADWQQQPAFTREPNHLINRTPAVGALSAKLGDALAGFQQQPALTRDTTPGYQLDPGFTRDWTPGIVAAPAMDNWQRARTLGMRRFALGSNAAQSAYADMGMSGYWVPTSNNPSLSGMELPDRLQMLADVGYPIPPSIASAATGRTAPQLNMGRAINEGRGLGVAPSLQALTRMTKGEQEATRGYYEGVGGTPWADLVDWISKPTSFLGKAAVSRGV